MNLTFSFTKVLVYLFTPSDQPDDGYPNPDKEIQAKVYGEIDRFLKKLKYIE